MISRQNFSITKEHRTAHNGHKSAIVWLWGLSGSGKSTIANGLEKRLFEMGNRTYILDGDNTRMGLNKGLGFSSTDRLENVRRIAEVAKLMADAGLIVIVSLITPHQEQRAIIREILKEERLLDVHVKCDLAICEQRDPKGLYKKARAGEIEHFTGVSDKFDPPSLEQFEVDSGNSSVAECVITVAEKLSLVLKQ
jgi:adenylyl-sulfate kinase